ncbi:MAG: 1,4-dihydroxy-2-naphthoate polyprenyltransferase [Anaerolineales bacterium]|nr:1,4-dihydroxy-2-naphthoate polyprenyltransferase [Anaerolineales bacterium]
MSTTQPMPTQTQAWISAMRPRTLPLAMACILMGSFLAAADGSFRWSVTVLSVLTAVFLQILSNLANDYGDSVHGADHVERSGPKRAVQTGLISAQAMKRSMITFALLSAMTGIGLLWVSFGAQALVWLLVFVLLGGAAIWAAINYTAGSNPYGYAGLGDIFVLIFFGWVGVMGTYFLQTQALNWVMLLPATSCGLLAVAVLNINNIRDIESDKKAGKHSIPVRIGPQKARLYHWALLSGAFLLALLYVALNFHSAWQFLFVLVGPLLVRNGTAVSRTHEPMKINPLLKQLSIITLVFILAFGIGQIIS